MPVRAGKRALAANRLFVVTAACLLAAGCATLPSAEPPPQPPADTLRASVQWREPAGSAIRVAEVFLANPSDAAVTLDALLLDGHPLRLPGGTSGKGWAGPLWWRVRPATTIPPGGSALTTLAFAEAPSGPLKISFVASGLTNEVPVPRFLFPSRLITSVVFPAPGLVAVQTASGTVSPSALTVNGADRPFLRLRDGRRGRPNVLVARLPAPVHAGDDVFIRVAFADGSARQAAVKALASASFDVLRADKAARKSLGLRDRLEVAGLPPEDVGCYDLESRHTGAALPLLIANAAKAPQDGAPLRAVHFCSGAVTATFDLYGAVADAAFSSSFDFERTDAPAARLAAAERAFRRVTTAVRPRPVLWYAGLFRRGGRSYTPTEADALFWTTLALGARGVRVYVWREKSGLDGIEALPDLADCVRRWTSVLDRRGDDLAALVPAEETSDGRLLVRTAWNPATGMLVAWRTEDLAAAGAGARLRVRRPEWLVPRHAEDLAANRRVNAVAAGDAFVFDLDPGASSGAFWIAARRPEIPGGRP